MNPDEKREIFHAAIELIVDRIVTEVRPKNAGAYAAKTRAELRKDHRDAAREIFGAYDDLGTTIDAQMLADLLEPPKPKPAKGACPWCGTDAGTAPQPPTFTASERPDASPSDRELARTRIAQIRSSLGGQQ